MIRLLRSEQILRATPLALRRSWSAHNGITLHPGPGSSVVRLLLGGSEDPQAPRRLVLMRGGTATPNYEVWGGSMLELDKLFEEQRLEALCSGHYVHSPLIETAELLDAADAGSIYLTRRLAFHDRTAESALLPEPRPTSPQKLASHSRGRAARIMRRLPDGRRAVLAITPTGGLQMSLLGPSALSGETYAYLLNAIERFAEEASKSVEGVNILDLLIPTVPEPPLLLDLLSYESTDIRRRPWAERQSLLRQLFSELPVPRVDLRIIETLDAAGLAGTPLREVMVLSDAAPYGDQVWVSSAPAA